MKTVRYVGAGAYVPPRVVKNDRITRAIPGWSPERIEQRTGIRERRFLWDFDAEKGQALPPPEDVEGPRSNTDMAEAAVRQALDRAGLTPSDLDGLYLVTTTPDRLNFCHDAVELHRRLGCRCDASAVVIDSGCGGAVYVADMARKLILSGHAKTIAVVASTFASAYLDREIFTSEMPGNRRVNAFLSMYMFGDGAGAIVLRGDEGTRLGVMASTSGTDHPQLVIHRGGGAQVQPSRATMADHAFFVDGPTVARAYPEYMMRAVDELRATAPEVVPEIQRYYLHQANKLVLLGFADRAGIPQDRVPVNVDRYGNTSAASTLLLFAEDVAAGRVKLGSGEPVLFAAVGAGVHFGGQIVRV
ncbi:3-oxoacyl-ACP synthase III family protein [Anaeromyxobacter oryzae]|uniref:3-oxoacyl-[acyl-carrier-protein] synthase 3 n=1 Tax=Anaeromyxobacter oryzae TaxID=2918170 RepID=A0ABM7WNP0_9BACT|nr:ketoacyl-ACP synthase III [Anaeromyxobacter oryzae]BDG01083.1 3-oxoacyl-[acyl-carrier-protein] synthase 3 [Anaeromyxobacter oryzae]